MKAKTKRRQKIQQNEQRLADNMLKMERMWQDLLPWYRLL